MGDRDAAEELRRLFSERGESQYGGEAVSQLEHGLQAAALAEQQQAPAALVVAALLHDVGHLLHDLPDDAPDNGIDDAHERIGAAWLGSRFPPEVLQPVALHVASKRYLCAVEPGYWEALSQPSRVSLELQGGPMTDAECALFRAGPHFEDAVRLRRWDDAAKDPEMKTPALDHFLGYVRQVMTDSPTKLSL